MLLRRAISSAFAFGVAIAAPTQKRGVAFDWGNEKIRGVNIGGWLVLEPWITPSIFEATGHDDIVDEYTLGDKLGKDKALEILRKHWDTWATWEDFKKIKDSGFNLVRIPIGFWAYNTFDSPYVQGAASYIDAAVDWSRGLGLKIIVDLHGAPGSQNGYDNSGQKMDAPRWLQGDSTAQTLSVLRQISDKYAQTGYQDVIVGVELINEPLIAKLDEGAVRQFYRDGFGQVRQTSDTTVVLHDGFKAPNTWNGFLTPSDNNARNVALDHHYYEVFTNDQVGMEGWQHRQSVCSNANSYSGADKWTFVGEWTGAMTDCAKYLNGRGVGARFDGTYEGSIVHGNCTWQNDLANWPDSYKDDTRGFIEAQMSTFEAKTQGWVWWNFKTEGAAEWDAFRLIDAGIFPQPLTDRKFGAICSNF